MQLKLIISFLLISLSILGQNPKLTAKVSAFTVPLNNKIRVRFSVNVQGADDFKAPNFKDFIPINTRPHMDTSTRLISINGNFEMTVQIGYTYIVKPKRKGKLIIAPASITYKGKILKSEPIEIYVSKAVINPNDPEYIASQNINLVTHVSNKKPFVGEPIFVEYRIYFKNLNVAMIGGDEPKFEGFWTQNIPVISEGKETKYRGEKWGYAVIKKVMIVPTKSGRLKIGKISRDIRASKQQLSRNLFGDRMLVNIPLCTKKFSSQNINITTRDFPEANKPDNFDGAVGDFDFTVTLDKNELKANQTAQIKVEVTGTGNLKSFKLPAIQAPEELELYDPENKIQTDISSKGLKGFMRDAYTLVPVYKGKYLIPAISFSYFNPKDKKYHTITSKDFTINVLDGKELPKENEEPNEKNVSNDAKFSFIQVKTEFTNGRSEVFFGSFWYYLLLTLPLLAIPSIVVYAKKRESLKRDIKVSKLKKASKLVKKHLKKAKKNIGVKDAFFESLEAALHNFLKAKLDVETSDISSEKIHQILSDRNVNENTITLFLETIKNCDFARYTRTTDVEMKVEFEKAKGILMQLDKQL